MLITSEYFKQYREKLGFSNQADAKKFLAGKDIIPKIDFSYISLLNCRLGEIINKINTISDTLTKVDDIENFNEKYIYSVFERLKENQIIPKLKNQGRRTEEVYFSWMRGFVISQYFLKSLSAIFEVNIENITLIGDDDLTSVDTFKRTPKADLEIKLSKSKSIRLEIQSGFQGVNDIKQLKVLEAKRLHTETNISSLVVHFDLFNGQVAFVKLDSIKNNNINWITRQQMEGQTVFNIDQNYFIWKLTENPPKFTEINSF